MASLFQKIKHLFMSPVARYAEGYLNWRKENGLGDSPSMRVHTTPCSHPDLADLKSAALRIKAMKMQTSNIHTQAEPDVDLWKWAVKKKEAMEGKDAAAPAKFQILMHKLKKQKGMPTPPPDGKTTYTRKQIEAMSIEEYKEFRKKMGIQ